MKKLTLILSITAMIISGCDKKEAENPFFSEWDTPYGVAPFDQIKTEHYKPAFLKGMEEQKEEIAAITGNKEEPTFENTIKAYEYSGELLGKVSRIFGSLSSSMSSDEIQAIDMEMSPLLSKHGDDISLDEELFKRVKSVYDRKGDFNLNEEETMLLDEMYKDFVRSGANLNESDKVKLRSINQELSMLEVQFSQNLLAETNGYKLILDKEEDLVGLPESVRSQAAAMAESLGMPGKWVFTIQVPSMTPFLTYSQRRDLREQLFTAYFMKGDNDNDNDNKAIISKMAKLRVERSQLLGYGSYADFALERTMAKTPETVMDFLRQIWDAAIIVAKEEANAQQELIYRDGDNFKLEPWDWWYYTDRIKKEKFDLDEETVRPYFMIDNVIDGMFYVANRLYDLEFTKRSDIPKYHEDVTTYEVTRDGGHIGVLYIDPYPRESKRGGAWCGAFRGQRREDDGTMVTPIVYIVTNSTPPTADGPALLSLSDAETFFHEFGHALHQLLSNSTFPSLCGTSVPRDFVELPSQVMEHWVLEPEVLKIYAKHYQTGEVIPTEIVEKINNAGKFNTGFTTTEFLAAALLDMEYHILATPEEVDIREFEKNAMDKWGLISEIKPRYRSTYFNHIWSSGYASGYYSYYWSEMLDSDAFQAFKETGDIFNKEVAAKFESEILSKGGTRDPKQMYINFRGAEPTIDALLENRGLKED